MKIFEKGKLGGGKLSSESFSVPTFQKFFQRQNFSPSVPSLFTKHLGYAKITVGVLPRARFPVFSNGNLACGGCNRPFWANIRRKRNG